MEQERVAGSAFGALLRHHRLAAGLSQEMLAERARMSVNGLGALERGDRRYPYRDTVALLTEALGLTPVDAAELEAAAARPRQFASNVVRPELTMFLGDRGGGRAPVPRALKTNLPIPRTSLVGREAEIAAVLRQLQDSPLVTVTGAGGVGKTRTALAVGEALVEQTQAGVWLVELAPLSQGALVATAVAQAFKVREAPDRSPLDTLLSFINQKSVLLVLDNCEHVIADAALLVEALLQGCPNLRILATSREPLRTAGERTYRLPSLRFPTPAEAQSLTSESAAAFAALTLFEQHARAVDHAFGADADNLPTIAAICRRLDGIPLAIEMAAARVNVLPLAAIMAALDERFTSLAGGRRAAPSRHQTMRGLIGWSYALLDDRERTLFRFLGIFVNGFVLEGAVAVCRGSEIDADTVIELLASLVNKSLVGVELQGQIRRYRLLESTRAFALEQLRAAGEHEALAARHLRYLRERFTQLRHDAERTGQTAEIRSALIREIGDIRAALDFGLTRDIVSGAQLFAAFYVEYYFAGLTHEAIQRAEQYLAALPVTESSLRSRVSDTCANLLLGLGQPGRALAFAKHAVALARECHDDAALTFALADCACSKLQLGRIGEVAAELDEAQTFAGATPLLRVRLLFVRALFYRVTGDIDRSLQCHEEAQHEYGADVILGATSLKWRAELEHERGATRRAVELARESIRAVELIDEALITPHGRAEFLGCLLSSQAGYLCAIDQFAEAEAAARDAIAHLTAIGNRDDLVAFSIEHLALVIAHRGEYVVAARLAGYADSVAQQIEGVRDFTEQTTFDRLRQILEKRLPGEEFRGLLADGAALTPEAAIDLAFKKTLHFGQSDTSVGIKTTVNSD